MKPIVCTVALIVPSLLLCSCDSIVDGSSKKTVNFITQPPGAKVSVSDSKGMMVYSGVTPTSAALPRSSGYFSPAKYTVQYSRNGKTLTVPLNAEMNPWYAGNFVFGGLLGLLVVDPLTGAMWTLPKECSATITTRYATTTTGKFIRIVDRADVPKAMEHRLVALR